MTRALLRVSVTLWAIASLTILLFEYAPGGPLSQEHRLDPLVEALNLKHLGLAHVLRAPCAGTLQWSVGLGSDFGPGQKLASVEGRGAGCRVVAPASGTVFRILSRTGAKIESGQVVGVWRGPFWRRYLRALASIARLDLGVTYSSRGERTVLQNIRDTLPVSAAVGGLALALALMVGVGGGLLAAAKRGSALDFGLRVIALVCVSTPVLVLAPLLLHVFALKWRVFGPGGLFTSWDLFLPSVSLGLVVGGIVQRLVRACALNFLESPAALALAARGLSARRLVMVHAGRHVLVTLVGFLPPVIAGLITGSVVVENVFNLPGLSRHLVGAALNRDYPMVTGVVLLYSAILVVLSGLSSVAHLWVDPRLRSGRQLEWEGRK